MSKYKVIGICSLCNRIIFHDENFERVDKRVYHTSCVLDLSANSTKRKEPQQDVKARI